MAKAAKKAKKSAAPKADDNTKALSEKKLTDEEIQKKIEERLPPEIKQRLDVVRGDLDKFQKKVLEKFDKYIVSVALLPPKRPEGMDEEEAEAKHSEEEKRRKEEEEKKSIPVLILVDDSDSKKMSKDELKEKLDTILGTISKEVNPNIKPFSLLLSELWTNCYDAKYEILQYLSLSAPVYDTGMLAAIKIAQVHKTMVLKKFEKYIISYVLAGSLVQGKATKESDIDVFVVIDDTDVKRMSRAELKDRLRAIILQMGYEAGALTGIQNKINIQTYILTDFWESIKEANPVIFTFLRDGVPFYDRGIFMPWKQLLRMGRIKPSQEAIEMYMSSGEQMVKRVQSKLNELGTEDFFWATLYPSQAAIMMYGLPPPTPKETPQVLRDIFVKKEKMLEEEFVKILEKIIKWRKDLEHGTKKEVTGKEIDELLTDSDRYLKRIKELFTQIETLREKESIINIHDTLVTVTRDVLKAEGVKTLQKDNLEKLYEQEIVKKGIVPEKYNRLLKNISSAKEKFDKGALEKFDVDKTKKEANEFIKTMVEHLQRKRARELEGAKLKVKYGEKVGEIIFLDDSAFITLNIDSDARELKKAKFLNNELTSIVDAKIDELEHSLANAKIPAILLNDKLMHGLKKIFGDDVQIILN